MSYLPWLAGGAALGLAARRGRRNVPFPLPPQLDLSSITLGAWTAVPVAEQKEDRWGPTTKLWNVVGPQKGFSLWRYRPKKWGHPLGQNYTLRMKKGSKWIGHVQVEEVRQGGESVWVVSASHLDAPYRRTGLGSLMYVSTRALIEAYKFKPIKMISTKDYGGSGTSDMAQKVWDRLRGEGRLNRRRGRSLPETGYTLSVVSIYRAVPRGVTTIKPMDYVTRTKKWAEGHADHVAAVEEEESIVLKAMVKSADVYEATNPGEYFYDGPAVRGRVIYRSQPSLPRGRGRRAQGSSFEGDLKSANVFLMDWVCDGWGKLPPKIQRIADKVGALTAAEKKTLVQWFRDTAPGNF